MAISELAYGAAVYTDGSSRPNPGFFGSGLHGYTYRFPEEGEKPTKVNSLTATTEGYVLTNDLDKTSAKPVVVLNYFESFQPSLKVGTNNIAEVNAVSMFFEQFGEIAATIKKLHVIADSRYTIDGATSWRHGWKKSNWIKSDGTPVSNSEEWSRLSKYLDIFMQNAEFTMSWTHGHNGDFGNTIADYLSSIGTNYSTDGIDTVYRTISDPKGYHKHNESIHPLLCFKRLYYNTDKEWNTPGQYFQASWSGNAEYIHGKRSTEAAYSIVRLKTPDPIVDALISKQEDLTTEFNTIVYAKLDRLKSADVAPWLAKFGKYALIPDKRYNHPTNPCLNINFVDQKPLSIEVTAGELPLRTIDVLNHLEEILSLYEDRAGIIDEAGLKSELYSVFNITDHFYTTTEKKVGKTVVPKTELKKSIVNNMKMTEIELETYSEDGSKQPMKLPIVFADDVPSRNTFKHIESLHPKVFFVMWKESSNLLRYATIIHTDDAVSIWSNYFANQIIL